MFRLLQIENYYLVRPSNGCQETREFSQTCTEKELPNGDKTMTD